LEVLSQESSNTSLFHANADGLLTEKKKTIQGEGGYRGFARMGLGFRFHSSIVDFGGY